MYAIANGDEELGTRIDSVNEALNAAKTALEAADSASKTELNSKIDDAEATLQAAIDALSAEVNNLKTELANKDAELEGKTNGLQTFVIIVCIISCVALCGSGALAVLFFIEKKKKS